MRPIRRTPLPLALTLAFVAAGCGETETPTALAPSGVDASHGASHRPAHAAQRNFRAHLTGAEEVSPVETRAQGQTIFQLSKDGTELSYRLIVANIQNVLMAHIHLGAAGVNGPVVVWLYPSGPPPKLIPGRTQGVLATGVITAADFIDELEGEPMEALIDAIRRGEAYVNVHTSENPLGHIRGQIR